MLKVKYLGEVDYFESFDEVKRYYDHVEASDVEDLNEILKSEYDGMVSPVVDLI